MDDENVTENSIMMTTEIVATKDDKEELYLMNETTIQNQSKKEEECSPCFHDTTTQDKNMNISNERENQEISNVDGKVSVPSTLINPQIEMIHMNGQKLIMDGETEIDDVLLAGCFAALDNTALDDVKSRNHYKFRNLTEDTTANNRKKFDDDELNLLLAKAGLQEISADENDQYSCSTSDDDEDDDDDDNKKGYNTVKKECSMKTGEEEYDDTNGQKENNIKNHQNLDLGIQLVCVEDLPKELPDSATISKIGIVNVIVDNVLLIKADTKTKPLDLGSITCTEDRKVLGPISDTFGPILAPFYVVHLSASKEPGETLPVTMGDSVFVDVTHASFLVEDFKKIPDYLHSPFTNDTNEDNNDDDDSSAEEAAEHVLKKDKKVITKNSFPINRSNKENQQGFKKNQMNKKKMNHEKYPIPITSPLPIVKNFGNKNNVLTNNETKFQNRNRNNNNNNVHHHQRLPPWSQQHTKHSMISKGPIIINPTNQTVNMHSAEGCNEQNTHTYDSGYCIDEHRSGLHGYTESPSLWYHSKPNNSDNHKVIFNTSSFTPPPPPPSPPIFTHNMYSYGQCNSNNVHQCNPYNNDINPLSTQPNYVNFTTAPPLISTTDTPYIPNTNLPTSGMASGGQTYCPSMSVNSNVVYDISQRSLPINSANQSQTHYYQNAMATQFMGDHYDTNQNISSSSLQNFNNKPQIDYNNNNASPRYQPFFPPPPP